MCIRQSNDLHHFTTKVDETITSVLEESYTANNSGKTTVDDKWEWRSG